MADQKISELTHNATPATTNKVPMATAAGANEYSTLAEIATAIGVGATVYTVTYAGEHFHGNVTLASALENGDSLWGETLATGDVVLLINQTTASENGPWVVAASGAPSRPSWFAAGSSASGTIMAAADGYMASRVYICDSAPGSDVVGTNNLSFARVPKAWHLSAAPTAASNNAEAGYQPGDTVFWSNVDESRGYYYAGEDASDPVWREIGNENKVRGVSSAFSIDADDANAIINFSGTSTGVPATVNQGRPGQVTTVVLTGTSGTLTFAGGSIPATVTVEPEDGKTLTTNAPGASTVVTVSLLYLDDVTVAITGGLA